MKENIKIVEKKSCCGCGACANRCPVDAIRMEWDEEGFYYPKVDETACIYCGKCTAACPALNPRSVNDKEPDCYAAYADDEIRAVSSSGGIFTLAAEEILDQGGVVAGAAFDEHFRVAHILVDNKKDLGRLRSSKYVQSTTDFVYRKIEKYLKEGRQVLFTGCGCQVGGLYGFLGKDYDNLFTIDLMCHGGPSPKVFQKYLKEVHKGKQVTYVSFRDKDYFGWSTEMTVKYADGGIYRKLRREDPYYRAFLPCLSVRPHCQICFYSRLPRQADMTLADFWGVQKYNPAYTDGKGTSILVTNNQKGRNMLEKIRHRLLLLEPVERKYILTHGQPFAKPFRSNAKRDRFMKLIQKFPMEKAMECCERDHFDVGICGGWSGESYGSLLSYYALANTVEDLGYTVLMIGQPPKDVGVPDHSMNRFKKFADENYAAVSPTYTFEELGKLNDQCDAFLMGSGQAWNPRIDQDFPKGCFFDFTTPEKKRISYAASFDASGCSGSEEERTAVRKLLKRFRFLSVREKEEIEILKKTFHVKGMKVLDPVFLQDRDFYRKLAEKSRENEKEPFLLAYILNPTEEIREQLSKLSRERGQKLINLLDGTPETFEQNKEKLNLPNTMENLQVEDWLYYLSHCDALVTDSGYGSSLALIFGKPFLCLASQRGGTSVEILFETFHLTERCVETPETLWEKRALLDSADYQEAYYILEQEKARSKTWLKKALDAKEPLKYRVPKGTKAVVKRGLGKVKRSIPVGVKKKIYPLLKNNKFYLKFLKRL